MAHRRAVRAANIVGFDLELRFGVDVGVAREQQVLVALDGVGLLRVLPYDHFAVEYAGRVSVENAAIKLVAVAVRHGVVDCRVVVDMLMTRDGVEPVQHTFTTLAFEPDVGVAAYELAAKRERIRSKAAVACLMGIGKARVQSGHVFLLQLVMFDVGVFRRHHFGDGVGPIGLAHADIGFDDGGLAVAPSYDERARMTDLIRLFRQVDEDEMNRLLDGYAIRDPNKGAIFDERCVERGQGVILRVGVAAQMSLDRIVLKEVSQAAGIGFLGVNFET